MSETLYVEGPDPDVLLERIREEYGAAACVISQKPVRRGGMFGFFSRELVGITYQVAVEDLPVVPADDGFALSDLLDRADSVRRPARCEYCRSGLCPGAGGPHGATRVYRIARVSRVSRVSRVAR